MECIKWTRASISSIKKSSQPEAKEKYHSTKKRTSPSSQDSGAIKRPSHISEDSKTPPKQEQDGRINSRGTMRSITDNTRNYSATDPNKIWTRTTRKNYISTQLEKSRPEWRKQQLNFTHGRAATTNTKKRPWTQILKNTKAHRSQHKKKNMQTAQPWRKTYDTKQLDQS